MLHEFLQQINSLLLLQLPVVLTDFVIFLPIWIFSISQYLRIIHKLVLDLHENVLVHAVGAL